MLLQKADAQKRKKTKSTDVKDIDRLVSGEIVQNLAEFADYFDAESARSGISIVRDLGSNVQYRVSKWYESHHITCNLLQ